ncbi:MAG: ACT domain-containing protein [Candidatus Theseobacter exili]|nr:ACT domain-containing protein [Candidatus Theseobacter exili]
MEAKAVLTAVGKDQTGIVAAVSGVLYELGCNLEGSSMTLLQGEFAIILILSFPERDVMKKMQGRINKLEKEWGLLFSFREVPVEDFESTPKTESNPYTLNVVGVDHSGIVHRITVLLADLKVNITNVNTRLIGEGRQVPVYVMFLELDVPVIADESEIQSELRKLADELRVDITFAPVDVFKG